MTSVKALLAQLSNPALPGIDLSLERMQQLLAVLGDPQKRMPPAIHVAGTNGKGSTIAFLCSIYSNAGYRVHAYTSPHLLRFNERIVLAGQEIDDTRLQACLTQVVESGVPATQFEAETAAAFLAFSQVPADILLLEVGLGGRLDATNLVERVLASVITPIGLDHREFLGRTLTAIATEKAGIIRETVPCISAPQSPEVLAVLQARAPHLVVAKPSHAALGLAGAHQQVNAGVASAVVSQLQPQLPVSNEILAQGLLTARWPGRLQHLTRGPLVENWPGTVMLDGGHNPHAAEALAAWAASTASSPPAGEDRGEGAGRMRSAVDAPPTQPSPARGEGLVVMIAGLMRRKDAREFLAPLVGNIAEAVFIPIGEESYSAEELKKIATKLGLKAHACDTLEAAVTALAHVGNATLLVAGSLHLAGEVLKNHG